MNLIVSLSLVTSLLHDDVFDGAEKRCGIGSSNVVMGNTVLLISLN
ncbi:hypothetical protein SLEP1_g25210 [Rubroshorea leprosula]|uniref:Uncharacterized protein n=1 Tax=Rubroshorea leprosula TaxID=152421 RepID=A0AAV5JQC4_9ROSI|nr:hypothetical protein SLEP1_g25210 [Rubroshorea leprosula]